MPDAVEELYALPIGEFIAARDRLAAKLTAAGQRDRAREVKALRRPTVAAWVVNQLARRHGAALRRLIDAGGAVGRAQRRTLRGGDADDLRAAAKRRQDALRELRGLAGPILRDAGSAAHLDDVLATLEAASLDPAAARVVSSGRLSKELPRPSGFGEAPSLTLVPVRATPPPRREGSRRTDAARSRASARQRAAEAKKIAREATRSARVAAQAARRSAAHERARSEHEKRVRQLREAVEKAERGLRDAEQEATRAHAEASRAAARAGELRERAQRVREGTDSEP